MTKILIIDNVPIPVFYRRRVSRIFPAFLSYLAITTLIFIFSHHDVRWEEFFSAITFTKNYYTQEGGDQMPLGHIWSLSVEEHSYIVLSGLAILSRIGRVRIITSLLFLIGAIVSICMIYYFTAPDVQIYSLTHRSEVAALPIFAAGLFMLLPRLPSRFDWMIAPFTFFVAAAVQWWSLPFPIRIIIGSFALAICIGTLGKAGRWTLACISWKPLRLLGLWSYSIYLWQQPFYLLQAEGLHPGLGALLGITCGIASYYLIESPARIYLNATWGKKTSVVSNGHLGPTAMANDDK